MLWVVASTTAWARIDGLEGTSFSLTAKAGTISLPDGSQPPMWGFAPDAGGVMQYPGPTLRVGQGDLVTVTLTNSLATSVSLFFPGQSGVSAKALKGPAGQGVLTLEAGPGGRVRYQIRAAQPGTYLYHSGTRPDLQIEMGLLGALIVRPSVGGVVRQDLAYATADTAFDAEFLFLLTEMDPRLHELAAAGQWSRIDTTGYAPTQWFINGRSAPDTLQDAHAPWLPHQPYDCQPVMEPGWKLLLRFIGGGRVPHPFHIQGNDALVIARDGHPLSSAPGAGADLATRLFTLPVIPGGTLDALFTWTGAGLGWDIYGHQPGDPLRPGESPADHGKPFPVLLPAPDNQLFGAYYSGSPFLGSVGLLPPGQGGLNPSGGYVYLWHSGASREMTCGGISPGGMMTMLRIEVPGSLAKLAPAVKTRGQ